MHICNAFSLQMLDKLNAQIQVTPVSKDQVKNLMGSKLVSAIGHADTAAVVSSDLGLELPANRVNVKLADGEEIVVAQFAGGRLPEGATTLPPGIELSYLVVRVSYPTGSVGCPYPTGSVGCPYGD